VCAAPGEFAASLDSRIRLAGVARVPIARGDGRAEGEPDLPILVFSLSLG
jgi:hypothetical protein